MKRFIISVILLVLSMSFILWLTIKLTPDNGIHRCGNSTELRNCSALFGLNGTDHFCSTAYEYEKLMEMYKEEYDFDSMDILYVTSTGNDEYNIRNMRYSFRVNRVIKGNDSLEGREIITEIIPQSFFQELDDSGVEQLKEYYHSIGLYEEEYPWLYSTRELCYSFTNVPKENDNYIIFVGEMKYSEKKEPMLVLLNEMMFSEADASHDKLLSYENMPIYKNYADNYTFFFEQEDLDWYVTLKDSIFEYYLS